MSAPDVVLRSAADVPARDPDPAHFAGEVRIAAQSTGTGIPVNVLSVEFAPGARTAWHTHPAGQVLVVTMGTGTIATRAWMRRMTVGDVVEIPANVEHWHGATPDSGMRHTAIQPDPATAWLEHVSEEEFAAPVAP